MNLTKRLEAYKVAIIHNRHYDRGRIEKKVHAFEENLPDSKEYCQLNYQYYHG